VPCEVQAILDRSLALEFMTEDAAQAEETRQQMLPVEGVAEVNIVDLPGWVALSTAATPYGNERGESRCCVSRSRDAGSRLILTVTPRASEKRDPWPRAVRFQIKCD
jgi:hypothetical protein